MGGKGEGGQDVRRRRRGEKEKKNNMSDEERGVFGDDGACRLAV